MKSHTDQFSKVSTLKGKNGDFAGAKYPMQEVKNAKFENEEQELTKNCRQLQSDLKKMVLRGFYGPREIAKIDFFTFL